MRKLSSTHCRALMRASTFLNMIRFRQWTAEMDDLVQPSFSLLRLSSLLLTPYQNHTGSKLLSVTHQQPPVVMDKQML